MDNNENKKVIIMRGLPGSGKSHYVEENYADACSHNPNGGYVCSADHFFERLALKEGKTYEEVFQPWMLSQAHADCLYEFITALAANEPVVIVDNTNTTHWEYMNYIAIATCLADYEVEIIEVPCPGIQSLKKFHTRNSHGVPWESMLMMFDRWEKDDRAVSVDEG
jgi:predicted kinase